MIRTAREGDREQIISLWNTAFGEEKEFSDWFFSTAYLLSDTIVCEKDRKLVSMLQRMKYTVRNLGEVSYIFGACTLAEYRGQGLMQSLIEYCRQLDEKEGRKACILIPQEKSLFDYYKRFGFEPAFSTNSEIVAYKAPQDKSYLIRSAKKADWYILNSLYESGLENEDYIIRDKQYWQTQIDMFDALGGRCVLIYNHYLPCGYAFVSGDANGEVIEEIMTADRQSYRHLVNLLMQLYDISSIRVVSFNGEGNEKQLGSAFFYDASEKAELKVNLLYN